VPRHRDGTFRVVKSQILIDCGQNPQYSNQNKLLWKNPEFLALLDAENRRRDCAIVEVVKDAIETVSGPMLELRVKMHENVQAVFLREPDSEDPLALSPDQYQKGALAWSRYIDELTGRTLSQAEQTTESVVGMMLQERKITNTMAEKFVDLLDDYRKQQDRQMEHAGLVIDGELA
jgi:hypothetical protein